MKRLLATILILTCFAFTALAQEADKSARQSVVWHSAEAISDGQNGVFIEWQSSYEINNLGYNVYRISPSGERTLLNPTPIAGSVLRLGENVALPAGFGYSKFDKDGSLESLYEIEEIDINGVSKIRQIPLRFDKEMLSRAGLTAETLEELRNPRSNQTQIEYPEGLPEAREISLRNTRRFSVATVMATQRQIAATAGSVKIAVNKEGFYRVSRQNLQNAGFNVAANSALWSLYVEGIEQPMIIGANGDYIEFYGKAIDTPNNDTRYYYLIVGQQPGKRIVPGSLRGFPNVVLGRSFPQIIVSERRLQYNSSILNGDEDNWYGGGVLSTFTQTQTITLRGIDTTATSATFDYRMQGVSFVQHQIQITLNGTEIGIATGNGRELMSGRLTFPTSLLIDGNNVVGFRALGAGVSFIDRLQISYSRNYRANENQLIFNTVQNKATQIGGFTSSNVRVFDLTDENNVTSRTSQITNQNGEFQVNLGANRPRKLLTVADSALITNALVTENTVSTWSGSPRNADLFIITHKNFRTEAERLATYRRGQGLNVQVADVEDIYDEETFGLPGSAGLKTFLQFQDPHYAIFFGDASYDPRNFSTNGFNDFVPTGFFDSGYGEAASDELLGDFNNDGVGEVIIGRLSTRDLPIATRLVNKIIAFEQVPLKLERGIAFTSDYRDYDFHAANLMFYSQLPNTTPVEYARLTSTDPTHVAEVRAQIQAGMNRGRFIVHYSGHGSNNAWANQSIFTNADAANLTNENSFMLITATCLNGLFAEATSETLGEVITKVEKGAVASWVSSTLTTPDGQDIMIAEFYRKVATPSFTRIGDAMKAGRIATFSRDVSLSWAYIGDPTLKIR